MRAYNVLFICLSILLPASAFAADHYICTPFKGIGFNRMLTGSDSIGNLSKNLENIEKDGSNPESIELLTAQTDPSLYTSGSKVPLKLVGQTPNVLTPLKFFKTISPVKKEDFKHRVADDLFASVYTLDASPITNIVAVAAENYAILLPETGTAISVCKKNRLEYSEHGAQSALERLQQTMISSGMLRQILPGEFDVQSQQLFPYLQELLQTTGIYGNDGTLISGVDVRNVGTTLVITAVALQTLRMLTTTLTKNPALAAIVFPTIDTEGLSIDESKVGLSSTEIKRFLNQSGAVQQERCKRDRAVKKLCTVLQDLDFEIAYAQGNAA